MNKTWPAGSACIRTAVVLLMMTVLMMVSAIQVTADTGTVKYQVTGGEITFDKSTGTVTECDKTVTEATIPAEIDGTAVKQIGQNAFSGCRELASVTLPEGLTRIARGSFDYTKITTISVPATVTYADPGAFYRAELLEDINVAEGNDTYCSKEGVMFNKEMTMLERYPTGKTCDKYTVPSGVTQIYVGAFSYSRNISGIVMPDSVDKIGSDAFRECSGLKKVDLPDSIKTIPQRCFYDCTALTEIKLPSMLSDIGTSAFWQCGSLKSVTIPGNVTEISDRAFAYCTALDEVTIPESVKTISDSAFNGSTNVTIYGVAGSYAETFAKNNSIKFSALPDLPEDNRKTQEIQCAGSFEKKYGDDDFDLCAYSTADSSDVKLQYESLSPDVAGVSDEGRVTIKHAGRAVIKITATETSEYKSASKEVQILVSKLPRTITTDKEEYELTYGDSTINVGLSVTGEGDITCYSDKPSVLKAVIHGADRQGLVTPLKPGTAVVTYTADASTNYMKTEKQITDRVNKAENRIGSKHDSLIMTCGEAAALEMTSLTGLEYESSDSSVATVTPDGTVQACGAGTAVITATAAENEYYKSTEKKITVKVGKGTQAVNAPSSFTKTFGAASFSIGASAKTPLKYRSSDTKTVTVSSSGKVTLKNPGKAYITVTAAETKDYRQASRTVRISSSLKKPSITLQAQKGRKVKISWNKVPGADGYSIYLYDSSKKKYTKLITRSSRVKSVLHKGLKAGKIYRYKIRAYRKVNGKVVYSSYSAVKEVRVKK